jgi:sugar diacid utilization regulator
VVLIAHPGTSEREVGDLTVIIQRSVGAAMHRSPDECYVGIGESRTALDEAYDSYVEARRATDVARVIQALGSVVRYSNLGVHGLLAEVPIDRLRRSIHPGLRRLHEYDTAENRLIKTLEAYFKNTGDVRRTADQLCVHRATVHYRLRRVQEITGVDLSDGDNWLALHLGLKVAQLVKL